MTHVINGDCLQHLKTILDNSIDAVVTDPPYGLRFMGKKWDYDVPSVEIWREVFRVLKPGGHVLSFGGTRTYHRMVVNIEDAGFEIRDQIQWLYGSGFPKSHDISKAIDKAAGAEREVVGYQDYSVPDIGNHSYNQSHVADRERLGVAVTAPTTPDAIKWAGWGTALKPANEPICLARKPLEGTVASNVLKHGTGALNIDASRIEGEVPSTIQGQSSKQGEIYHHDQRDQRVFVGHSSGRWPANLVLDEDAAAMLGEPSRFFYCAKASKRERGDGNNHPTVKPVKLMEYLIRLITPPGGTVLDPFMGSGTTGVAAHNLGFNFVGIEREAGYVEIAKRRLEAFYETS